LVQVAEALVAAGRNPEAAAVAVQAEAAAQMTTAPTRRAASLAYVAEVQVRAGLPEQAAAVAMQAEAAARSISEIDEDREWILARVASALTAAGHLEQAMAMARITDPRGQAGALNLIASRLAEAGQPGRAMTVARSIPESRVQATTFACIAETLMKAGDTRSASRAATAACATGLWAIAVRPVLLLNPSALTDLL